MDGQCVSLCHTLNFQWVEDIINFDVSSIASDSPTGYILEVDLEYPQRLHNIHAPFCPTRAKPPGSRQDKLLATVYDKQRYVIHYRNLQQCTRHGLRIKRHGSVSRQVYSYMRSARRTVSLLRHDPLSKTLRLSNLNNG